MPKGIYKRTKPTWNKGKKCPYVIEFNKRTKTGIKLTLEHRKKCSDALSGCKNPAWRGGRKIHESGYIEIHIPIHPFSNSHGYMFEHRLVMEKHIGRYLLKSERVHHINGIKDDNRFENLMLFHNESAHQCHHHQISVCSK
jgi:uncharacterized protein (DUF1330 family)